MQVIWIHLSIYENRKTPIYEIKISGDPASRLHSCRCYMYIAVCNCDAIPGDTWMGTFSLEIFKELAYSFGIFGGSKQCNFRN